MKRFNLIFFDYISIALLLTMIISIFKIWAVYEEERSFPKTHYETTYSPGAYNQKWGRLWKDKNGNLTSSPRSEGTKSTNSYTTFEYRNITVKRKGYENMFFLTILLIGVGLFIIKRKLLIFPSVLLIVYSIYFAADASNLQTPYYIFASTSLLFFFTTIKYRPRKADWIYANDKYNDITIKLLPDKFNKFERFFAVLYFIWFLINIFWLIKFNGNSDKFSFLSEMNNYDWIEFIFYNTIPLLLFSIVRFRTAMKVLNIGNQNYDIKSNLFRFIYLGWFTIHFSLFLLNWNDYSKDFWPFGKLKYYDFSELLFYLAVPFIFIAIAKLTKISTNLSIKKNIEEIKVNVSGRNIFYAFYLIWLVINILILAVNYPGETEHFWPFSKIKHYDYVELIYFALLPMLIVSWVRYNRQVKTHKIEKGDFFITNNISIQENTLTCEILQNRGFINSYLLLTFINITLFFTNWHKSDISKFYPFEEVKYYDYSELIYYLLLPIIIIRIWYHYRHSSYSVNFSFIKSFKNFIDSIDNHKEVIVLIILSLLAPLFTSWIWLYPILCLIFTSMLPKNT